MYVVDADALPQSIGVITTRAIPLGIEVRVVDLETDDLPDQYFGIHLQFPGASGKIRDHSKMEIQMRQTYANAKKILSEFGATLDNVVEEVLYVTDMDIAFAVAGPVRKEAYGAKRPEVASTILVTPRLALPTQLIEIKFIAKV